MKNPLTSAGIEPATFRIVAHHLNHCATAVPWRNKLMINSASSWFLLHRYIEMHRQQNIKFSYIINISVYVTLGNCCIICKARDNTSDSKQFTLRSERTTTSSSEAITGANSESTVTFHNFELNSIFGPWATGCTQLTSKCWINITSILNSILNDLRQEICRDLIWTTSIRTTRYYAYSRRSTAPAVGHRHLLAEVRFHSQNLPMRNLWSTKWDWDRFLTDYFKFPPVSHIPTNTSYSVIPNI